MTLLLDSTFLVDALRKRPEATALMVQLVTTRSRIATSVINLAEIYAGMRAGEESSAANFFKDLQVFEVTPSIAVAAGRLKSSLARKGQTRELDDMIVAATALEFGLTIVTNNRKDFEDTGVTIYGAGGN